MKSLIERIYDNKEEILSEEENDNVQTDILKELSINEDKIKEILGENNLDLLHTRINLEQELLSEENREAFQQGFIIGTRIAYEVLT